MTELHTVFLGTSTVLLTDGTSSILVDGYFSRPSLTRLFTTVAPDPAIIDRVLERAGIRQLDVVLVSHSHVDHALDSPLIAARTGALLAGSESTRMIALGYGVGDANFLPLVHGTPITVGDFTVSAIHALHSPGDRYPGEITAPLTVPAKTSAFKSGQCFSFHFDHPAGRVMVHPSANFIAGALDAYPSDVIYLGAGAAGAQEPSWRHRYWDETVVATGARTVLPIHWDRFWRPLEQPLKPFPKAVDKLEMTLVDWQVRANREHIDLRLPNLWEEESVTLHR